MRLASKSRNELFCCRRRTIRVDLRQYFCYRLLKNSRNDFLLRYIDDAVCIQSEFWNDRKADEGEGHKDADVFRHTVCLEGIVQRLHFRRNTLCSVAGDGPFRSISGGFALYAEIIGNLRFEVV